MPYDADDFEDAYIDYLAESETGFLGGLEVRLIGMDEACERLVDEVDSVPHWRDLVGPSEDE